MTTLTPRGTLTKEPCPTLQVASHLPHVPSTPGPLTSPPFSKRYRPIRRDILPDQPAILGPNSG
ncbi:hypothetical protein K449DRAFT_392508 [Hypoxylon sp. EC38]|nr:hypothetical protein K449DRAFT_392508 [Hypoxylon sp. EC38]